MKKKVFISALGRDEKTVSGLMGICKQYGLDPNGHFWTDDTAKMAWSAPLREIDGKDTALWLVLGKAEEFSVPTVRLGLSLLALCLQARKGYGFPILLLVSEGELDAGSLPTPLKGADIFKLTGGMPGPKIAALAASVPKPVTADYRIDFHAIPGIGLWAEIGPREGEWNGALLGVQGAEIDFHGVGPAGGIPERTVLEYPTRGMKIGFRDKEGIAWGVQNKLDPGLSYFARIQGKPESILFGPFPGEDEADMHCLVLY